MSFGVKECKKCGLMIKGESDFCSQKCRDEWMAENVTAEELNEYKKQINRLIGKNVERIRD